MMKRFQLVVAIALASAMPALAEGLGYSNLRYQFVASIPLNLTVGRHVAATGEAVTSMSNDGKALLEIWGNALHAPDFAAEVKMVQDGEHSDGWSVMPISGDGQSAAFTGTKADQVYFERMITACDGKAAVHYRLQFPLARKAEFESAVAELDGSLKSHDGICKLD